MVRNREVGVIEGCAKPTRGRMAGLAGGWIISSEVVWNGAAQSLRTVPVRQVATVAKGIRSSQGVVAAHVTLGASGNDAARRRNHLVSAC